MATIKAVSSHASIGRAVKYVMQDAKRIRTDISAEGMDQGAAASDPCLATGINCAAFNAMDQMMLTKRLWNKMDGRTYKHYTQNFAPGESTPEEVHRIGLELAGRMKPWEGFEVIVVTHTDKHYWHNHFIVNSVNIHDGHKLQWRKFDLVEMKRINDELCLEHGLSVPEKGKTYDGKVRTEATTYSRAFYENFLKENASGKDTDSYIFNIAVAVMEARAVAKDKEEFISLLAEKNIGVTWEDDRKYITFTDLERVQKGEKKCKIRNKKLEQYFHVPFGKEELQNRFDENRNREYEGYKEREGAAGRSGRTDEAGPGEHSAETSIGRIEREVREIAGRVESLASGKREEPAARLSDPGTEDHTDPGRSAESPDSERSVKDWDRKHREEPVL